MSRLLYIIALVLLVNLTACETEIAYNGNGQENFLVLNATINPDSLLQCHVTRSNSFSEQTPIKQINDAVVSVYEDGNLIENLQSSGNGYYTSSGFKPSIGKEYTVKVEHSKFKTVKANATIPVKADASLVSVRSDEYTYESVFNVTINDKVGADYYQLLVFRYGVNYDDEGNAIEGYFRSGLYSSDPIFTYNKVVDEDSDFSDDPDNVHKVFNDDLFDGQSYKFKFSMYDDSEHPPLILIAHLSEDLYLYYSSVQSKDYYEDNPFSEPVRIHTNINGGAGILGGMSVTVLQDVVNSK